MLCRIQLQYQNLFSSLFSTCAVKIQSKLETKALPLPITTRKTSLAIHVVQKITIIHAQKIGNNLKLCYVTEISILLYSKLISLSMMVTADFGPELVLTPFLHISKHKSRNKCFPVDNIYIYIYIYIYTFYRKFGPPNPTTVSELNWKLMSRFCQCTVKIQPKVQ